MTEGGFITVQSIVWQDKIYESHPEPSTGNRCAGCAFRADGDCGLPKELRAYTCIDTRRSDYRGGIIWKESEA